MQITTIDSQLGPLVNVWGDVDLSEQSLTHFPVQYGYVSGNFTCARNRLKSLRGAPLSVGGTFDCSYNEIKSLAYSPVTTKLHCQSNSLTSLEGIKNVSMYTVRADRNQLVTLKGMPKFCRNLFVSDNQLLDLDYCPDEMDVLVCRHNPLTVKNIGSVIKDLFITHEVILPKKQPRTMYVGEQRVDESYFTKMLLDCAIIDTHKAKIYKI